MSLTIKLDTPEAEKLADDIQNKLKTKGKEMIDKSSGFLIITFLDEDGKGDIKCQSGLNPNQVACLVSLLPKIRNQLLKSLFTTIT